MVTIRPAQRRDAGAIQRVARTTWHAAYDELLGADAVDEQVDEWYADAVVRDGIEDDETVYLVATADETVVGYASAGPAEDGGPDRAALSAIYVQPDHWGTGIGTRLLDDATERLRARGFQQLRIRVLADNERARAFYERRGYTVRHAGSVDLAGGRVEEVVYGGPL